MREIKQFYLVSWLLAAAASSILAQGGPEEIRLTTGKSIVIDYPADIARISTSNPDIVDASPVTGREVLVHGKAFGTVTLVVWSKAGQRNFYNITVEQNLEPLRKLLKETFPKEDIHVQSSRDSLSLTGRVESKDVADRATALATPFRQDGGKQPAGRRRSGREADPAPHQVRRTGSGRIQPIRGQPGFDRRHQHHWAGRHRPVPAPRLPASWVAATIRPSRFQTL